MKNKEFSEAFPADWVHGCLRTRLGDVAVFENRQPGTAAWLFDDPS